ncbi:MAG: DUF5005 domain-containing protein [Sphingobacteriaceae bacterium]|nr:MAG: DUF5005 domain-containing protein [Sphingobacteriaceae bacterium]
MKNPLLSGVPLLFLLTTSYSLSAQNFVASTDPKLQSANYTVEEDTNWTALFKRTKGWFGADGIFSIPLDGVDSIGAGKKQKTLFVFSDTLIGEVKDGKPLPGTKMPHNTIGYMENNTPNFDGITFHWNKDEKGVAESVFHPTTPGTQKGDYFWLGDGFVNTALNNTTYIFAYRIKNIKEGMGFTEVGNVLIAIPQGSEFPFKDQRQMDTPFWVKHDNGRWASFGAGILDNSASAKVPGADGYVYVYGLRDPGKQVMVARVKPKDFEKFDQWRFFDGKGWNKDILKAATIADRASNEMSVTPLPDGRYAMVFQVDGMGKQVSMRLGSSPYGPFGPIINLYSTDKFADKVITYNAKAHPSLSQPGELLISYNVNFTDFFNQLNASPDIYRPRFIKLKFK